MIDEIEMEGIQAKIIDLGKSVRTRQTSNEEMKVKYTFYQALVEEGSPRTSKIILCGEKGVVKVFSISENKQTTLDQDFTLQLSTDQIKELNLFSTIELEWRSSYCQKTQKLKNLAQLPEELQLPLSIYQEIDIRNPSRRRLLALKNSVFEIERQSYEELILQHAVSPRSWLRNSLFVFLKRRPRSRPWNQMQVPEFSSCRNYFFDKILPKNPPRRAIPARVNGRATFRQIHRASFPNQISGDDPSPTVTEVKVKRIIPLRSHGRINPQLSYITKTNTDFKAGIKVYNEALKKVIQVIEVDLFDMITQSLALKNKLNCLFSETRAKLCLEHLDLNFDNDAIRMAFKIKYDDFEADFDDDFDDDYDYDDSFVSYEDDVYDYESWLVIFGELRKTTKTAKYFSQERSQLQPRSLIGDLFYTAKSYLNNITVRFFENFFWKKPRKCVSIDKRKALLDRMTPIKQTGFLEKENMIFFLDSRFIYFLDLSRMEVKLRTRLSEFGKRVNIYGELGRDISANFSQEFNMIELLKRESEGDSRAEFRDLPQPDLFLSKYPGQHSLQNCFLARTQDGGYSVVKLIKNSKTASNNFFSVMKFDKNFGLVYNFSSIDKKCWSFLFWRKMFGYNPITDNWIFSNVVMESGLQLKKIQTLEVGRNNLPKGFFLDEFWAEDIDLDYSRRKQVNSIHFSEQKAFLQYSDTSMRTDELAVYDISEEDYYDREGTWRKLRAIRMAAGTECYHSSEEGLRVVMMRKREDFMRGKLLSKALENPELLITDSELKILHRFKLLNFPVGELITNMRVDCLSHYLGDRKLVFKLSRFSENYLSWVDESQYYFKYSFELVLKD